MGNLVASTRFRRKERILKPFLQKLAMVLGAMLFFLVVAEITVRAFVPAASRGHGRYVQSFFCKPDKLLGWLGIPHKSGKSIPSSLAEDMEEMAITINGEGFFDDHHAVAKPEGIKRLLFLGDSFTAGIGIPKKNRFTDLIKERLSTGYEVLNMAIWGYSTDQELLALEEKGLKYNPDIVVLCMFVDDLFCSHLFSVNDGIYIKPKFSVTAQDILRLKNIPVKDNHGKSALWNFILTRFYKLLNRIEMGTEYDQRGWLSIFDKTYLASNRYYLGLRLAGEIASVAKAKDSKVLVVCIPWKDQIIQEYIMEAGESYAGIPLNRLDLGLPQKLVSEFCRHAGVPFLDLLPAFKKHGRSEKLFFDKDLHWTKAGHRLAADQILAYLQKLNFL
jgi:lysophospholipase L1-like esterase